LSFPTRRSSDLAHPYRLLMAVEDLAQGIDLAVADVDARQYLPQLFALCVGKRKLGGGKACYRSQREDSDCPQSSHDVSPLLLLSCLPGAHFAGFWRAAPHILQCGRAAGVDGSMPVQSDEPV